MARTRFLKNGTVSITGLTQDEYSVLWECVSRCKDVMKWDDNEGYACDGDNFLWMIDNRKEYDTLQNLDI